MSLNQRATAEFSTYVHQVLLKPATYPSKHIVQLDYFWIGDNSPETGEDTFIAWPFDVI